MRNQSRGGDEGDLHRLFEDTISGRIVSAIRLERSEQQECQHVQVKGDGDKGVTQLLVFVILRDSLRDSDNIVLHSSRSLTSHQYPTPMFAPERQACGMRGSQQGLVPIPQWSEAAGELEQLVFPRICAAEAGDHSPRRLETAISNARRKLKDATHLDSASCAHHRHPGSHCSDARSQPLCIDNELTTGGWM